MVRPPRILVIALVSAIGGLIFLANSVSGTNWLINGISSPIGSQGVLPVANAIGKDLMLDVSPQLHPSVIVGTSANSINFQHWIDQEIHCEDCLRLAIPNNGENIGVAFSNAIGYNFEEAKKIGFLVSPDVEQEGATVSFRAVGNDNNNSTSSVSADDPFKNQEFAVTSQNVTLNQTWNYFEMSLDGVQSELNNVKYPFAFEVEEGTGSETTILYLKGIMYSAEPPEERFLLQEASSSDNLTASIPASTTTSALNITLTDNATETVDAPATVEFNATVSDGQEPYSFDWDFKDGATEADTDDANIAHTFATPGSYNVTVDVVDSLNNTGSANTLVDVAENQTVDDQPAITSEDNSTQDSQPSTGALNNTNTTSPAADTGNEIEEEAADAGNGSSTDAAEDEELVDPTEGTNTDDDGSANDTEANNNTNTGTGSDTESNGVANNSPPIANAGSDLVGVPNGQIILDASKSSDPDTGDTIVSYQWEQESGPAVEINDQASPTPIVTLPNVDEDSTVVFSLTVNDGSVDSEEEDTVSIFVDHVDQLTNDVQQRVLKPVEEITASEWIPSGGCEECLSDGSHATFVSAGTENIDSVSLYSFGEFSEGGGGAVVDPNSLVIERVVAEITAKKLGNTGYISFAVDDPTEEEHYFTPSISIGSNSFQKYYQVWDMNPVTGESWTYDSLNSLTAGFKYDGGQSGVQISELQLTVSYYLPEPALAPEPEPEPAPSNNQETAEDGSDSGANENEENGEDGTNGAQDTDQEEQEEPATETDSTDSDTADATGAEGEDSSESEE